MSNKFDEMRQAVAEATHTLQAADGVAARMGEILVGRLRHCGLYTLKQLKRELRDFNIHTGEWRKR